jgi:hypothetical protein
MASASECRSPEPAGAGQGGAEPAEGVGGLPGGLQHQLQPPDADIGMAGGEILGGNAECRWRDGTTDQRLNSPRERRERQTPQP